MDTARAYIESVLAEYARRYTLRAHPIPINFTLTNAANDTTGDVNYVVPSKWPILIYGVSFESIRVYDGRIVSIEKFKTEQVNFIDRPGCLGGWAGEAVAGAQFQAIGPWVIAPRETITIALRRLLATDPAELYPVPAQPSLITIWLHSNDLLPPGKGAQVTE
jgi:hypothetical protein